jgi:serine/threonine protein kinase
MSIEEPDEPVEVLRLVGVKNRTLVLAGPEDATVARPGDGEAPAAQPKGPPASDSRYALLSPLGAGAMGEVHLARDVELRRKVALKRMVPAVAQNQPLAARFVAEVQVTAQLDHPNIVPIYGLEVAADGAISYAMKLVQGRTLTAILDEARRRPGKRADEPRRLSSRLEIFLKVCDAMACAHSRGVLHRDLKPDNIMVGKYNQVYVMDWGICRVMHRPDDEGDGSARSAAPGTQYGALLGTPAYMSPEQAAGKNPELDGRSDQYTLGLILFELVTLKQALTAGSLEAVLVAAAEGQKNPIAHLQPRVPIARELKAIVDKATARDRNARYPTVTAFADDLRRYLRGDEVRARRDRLWQRATRYLSRHRAATLVALLSLLLAGAGAAVGLLVTGQRALARARLHEQRVMDFRALVAQKSHALDNHFHHYEKLLEGLAGRADELLIAGVSTEQRNYFASDFETAGRAPPDLTPSARYGRAISLDWPVFVVAPAVDRARVAPELRNLALLRPVFKALFTDSQDSLFKLFVTTATGVHINYPGWGGFPATYDGRLRAKYRVGKGQHEIAWGDPYADLFGQPLLPCATGLYDEHDRPIGVTGFVMSFEFIRQQLLNLPELPSARHTYLVNDRGLVVVSWPAPATPAPPSPRAINLDEDVPVALETLPDAEVTNAILAKKSGHLERKDAIVAYFPLEALGWYYVVEADPQKLLR